MWSSGTSSHPNSSGSAPRMSPEDISPQGSSSISISARDQQQLDAVAALTSLTTAGAGGGVSFGATHMAPQPLSVSRQYSSDTTASSSAAMAHGGTTTSAAYYAGVAPPVATSGTAAFAKTLVHYPAAPHETGNSYHQHRSLYGGGGDPNGGSGYYAASTTSATSNGSSSQPPGAPMLPRPPPAAPYAEQLRSSSYDDYARLQHQASPAYTQSYYDAAFSNGLQLPTDHHRHYHHHHSGSTAATNNIAGNVYNNSNNNNPSDAGMVARHHHHHPQQPIAAAPAQDGVNGSSSTTSLSHRVEAPPPQVYREPTSAKPRGKPEAMARALAVAALEQHRSEIDGIQTEPPTQVKSPDSPPTTAPQPPPPKTKTTKKSSSSSKKTSSGASSHKPASGIGSKKSNITTTTSSSSSPKASSKKTKKAAPTSPVSTSSSSPPSIRSELTLYEKAPPITEAEYENLEALVTQFCRVPLLAEFSRPVARLHPELAAAYSKIVTHPMDLGHVCRGIRRRQYTCLRDVRLDVWRVFANCVKYNSHPSNKDAVPSFVSIALHLRDNFNNLWQEYMIPSDLPSSSPHPGAAFQVLKKAYIRREKERQKRLESNGVLVLSDTFTEKMAARILDFIESGGLVDKLDTECIIAKPEQRSPEVEIVVQRLRNYQNLMLEVVQTPNVEYTVEAFYKDLRKCYTEDVLEDDPVLRKKFANRLDRLFWKYVIPLHEANARGVTQSSIWGNIAAVIWARESSKKPYWPALCLGILPPPSQREGWHDAVTERNENRLPDRLRTQLKVAKRRCEQAQKRLSMSYFLVEFMGTHEFIWVRETDIIENFDPEEDPNKNLKPTGKKNRSSRSVTNSVVGSQMYATAIEECQWANTEYENVLQDAFEFADDVNEEDNDEEDNYSFPVLAQSDDEGDQANMHGYKYDTDEMGLSDVDEANYLLSHDGILDTSADGRKNAKKRTQEMKKQAAAAKKHEAIQKHSPSKKSKATSTKLKKPTGVEKKSGKKGDSKSDKKQLSKDNNEKENKKEQKEVEKRRKKRSRELEKFAKNEAKKKGKRKRPSPEEDEGNESGLARNKRARATAVVNAYLLRWAKEDETCKSLSLNGILTMPAAMVDSTGLIGAALAFRAAAGELVMPDGEESIARTKPWAAIDSEQPMKSEERVSVIEKQIKLVEKELERVRKDTEKRKLLGLEYPLKRRDAEAKVEEDDVLVRGNPLWKKKKSLSAKTESSRMDGSPRGSENVDSHSTENGAHVGNHHESTVTAMDMDI